jgi:hypothetical protein
MSLGFRVPNVTALAQRAAAQAFEQGLAAFLGPSAFSVSVLSICSAVPRACVYESRSLPRRLLDTLPHVETEEDEEKEEESGKDGGWQAGRHRHRRADSNRRRGLQAPSANPLVTVTVEILFADTASVEALTRDIRADPAAFAAAVGSALAASDPAVFGAWVATSVAVDSSSLHAVALTPSGAAEQALSLLPTLVGAAIGVGFAACVAAAIFALRWKLKGRNAVAPLSPPAAAEAAADLETRAQVIRISPEPATASGLNVSGGIGPVGGGGRAPSVSPEEGGPRVAWEVADHLPATGGVAPPPGSGAGALLLASILETMPPNSVRMLQRRGALDASGTRVLHAVTVTREEEDAMGSAKAIAGLRALGVLR